jgi:RNA polymerase sigma factor (sigma-70 family)
MQPDEQQRSDAELLALTDVDPEAFGVFYARYERPILGYLFGRVRDPEVASDLAAEVFAAALEAAASFDPAVGGSASASGWLFTIAHNTLVSSLRRGRVAEAARLRLGMREPLALDDLDIERVQSLASAPESWRDLLEGLPSAEREAIVARVLHERDYADIARELGCSTLVARKRVSRGLSRLRNALGATAQQP